MSHQQLSSADGVLAYELTTPTRAGGEPSAPLVVCLPGMGDVRSAYRDVAPLLAERGCRVAALDLPGHGDSAAGAAPSQTRIAEHAVALVRELGGPAVVVGHSYTPDSALLATQLAPDQVVGAVCLAPWASPPPQNRVVRWVARTVGRSPWLWGAYYRSLHKRPPADLADHVERVRAALRRDGGTATLVRMADGEGKDAGEARSATRATAVVLMGERDPDFRDPRTEAESYAAPFGGRVHMLPGVGHYPHAEAPQSVVDAVEEVLAGRGAARRG